MATTIFKLSQLSMTMIEGVVSSWHKNLGDEVQEGEPLLEVETDKMVKDITAPATGYLVKLCAQPGDIVPVDGELCVISDDRNWSDGSAEDAPAAAQAAPAAAAPAAPTAAAPAAAVEAPATEGAAPGGKVRISPLAKRIAQMDGVDYTRLKGTGPNGTIVKRDILEAEKQRPAAVVQASTSSTPDLILPFQGIRKRTADHMMLTRQNTAMLTTCAEVNLSRLAECRKFVHASYTTYAIKAAAKALEEERFQMIRSQLLEDGIHIKQDININVSVATGRSLITPVIRRVNEKNILSVSKELKDLTERGRNNELQPEDMQDGCFTITNSGVFGSLFYTPIINYPQAAILGMGKILKTPVVVDDEITVAPMMYLCLSYDHRLIDGETGAPFLQKVKYYMEHPEEIIE